MAKEFMLKDDNVRIPGEDIMVSLIDYGMYERVNISFITLGGNESNGVGWL